VMMWIAGACRTCRKSQGRQAELGGLALSEMHVVVVVRSWPVRLA
jgi:hypothetical protein